MVFSTVLSAQNSHPLSCRFEKYYLEGNMGSWEQLADSMQEQRLSKLESDVLLQAQYGLIGYYFSQNQKKEAAELFKHFDKRLDDLLNIYPSNADYLSFRAASYGFRIALAPLRAPFLSGQHQQAIEKALEQNRGNALPYIEQGNSLYFRPAFVGGDKQKAKVAYEKALSILELQGHCDWLYYNTASWLGQVYTNLGEPEKAYQIYTDILEKEPEFDYVKNELLPQLLEGKFIDVSSEIEKNMMPK